MSNGKKKPKYHKIPEVQRSRENEHRKNAKIKKIGRTEPTLAEKISSKAANIRDNYKRKSRNAIIADREKKLNEEFGKIPPPKKRKRKKK